MAGPMRIARPSRFNLVRRAARFSQNSHTPLVPASDVMDASPGILEPRMETQTQTTKWAAEQGTRAGPLRKLNSS